MSGMRAPPRGRSKARAAPAARAAGPSRASMIWRAGFLKSLDSGTGSETGTAAPAKWSSAAPSGCGGAARGPQLAGSAVPENGRARHGCPYCGNRKVLRDLNDLRATYPALAGQWNHKRNGKMKPSNTIANSCKRVWWRYERGHDGRFP